MTAAKKRVARLGAIDNYNIGIWAAEKAPTEEHEANPDCTNFISKAMHRGGGVPERDGDRKSDKAWWENRRTKVFWWKDSYTWSAVINHHRPFQWPRPRLLGEILQ
ncbi:amidase domain-containing protein [Actinomadura sp. KC06]|uniref:amidase domain-containing protein n=1 Tax=Actinomadura sp. KC06 TaxID=2530369 RepID=UPI0014045DF7|nr:amidase domain-containing protein [Actinomadura sp. KC06]